MWPQILSSKSQHRSIWVEVRIPQPHKGIFLQVLTQTLGSRCQLMTLQAMTISQLLLSILNSKMTWTTPLPLRRARNPCLTALSPWENYTRLRNSECDTKSNFRDAKPKANSLATRESGLIGLRPVCLLSNGWWTNKNTIKRRLSVGKISIYYRSFKMCEMGLR